MFMLDMDVVMEFMDEFIAIGVAGPDAAEALREAGAVLPEPDTVNAVAQQPATVGQQFGAVVRLPRFSTVHRETRTRCAAADRDASVTGRLPPAKRRYRAICARRSGLDALLVRRPRTAVSRAASIAARRGR